MWREMSPRSRWILALGVGGVVLVGLALFFRWSGSEPSPTDEQDEPAAAETFLDRLVQGSAERPEEPRIETPPPPTRQPETSEPAPFRRYAPPERTPAPPQEPVKPDPRIFPDAKTLRTSVEIVVPEPTAEPTVLDDWSLAAGTRLVARLEQRVDTSERVGVTAVLTHDVYDSATGRRVLLPKGSRLVGLPQTADELDAAAQIAWTRIVTPTGAVHDLERSTSTDRRGGFVDGRVRRHGMRKAGAVLVSALTAASLQAAQEPRTLVGGGGGAVISPGQRAVDEGVNDLTRVMDRWAERRLSEPPRIVLPAGTEVLAILEETFHLERDGA